MQSSNSRQSGIFWLLWAVAASLPWLLPTHSAPWTTFYQELLMVGVAVVAGVWAVLARRERWRVDPLVVGFLVAALIPLAQAAARLFIFPAEAPLASGYLVGIALTLLIARHAEEAVPGRLIGALFAGLAIASLVSTGIALCQWLGVDVFGPLLAPMPFHDRPVANVGQPNNLSTLLGWGLVAFWWAHIHKKIGGACAVLGAAFVMIGITLTQSRAGVLEVVLLGAVACLGRRTLRTAAQAPALIGLAAWFIACSLAFEPLTALWTDQWSRALLNLDSPRERTTLLKMVLTAIGERPWFGWGWNQNVTAHVALAQRFPMQGTVGNAHNLVLDLMVWNGIPIGAALTLGLLAWVVFAVRRARTPEQFILLAAVGVLWVHTMLELPHVLAYFLVPAAIVIGTLNARAPLPTLLRVPVAIVGAAVVATGVVGVLMFGDYTRIERNGIDAAMRAARLARATPERDPQAVVLSALQEGLSMIRTEPRRDMSVAQLSAFRQAVTRYPAPSALFRYAEAAVLNHRIDDARWALEALCDLHDGGICAAAAQDWKTLAADGRPEMLAVDVPNAAALPGRTSEPRPTASDGRTP